MKTLTNHTIGPKGVNLKNGTTRWIEPGETIEIDDKELVGGLPDLGKPASKADDEDGDLIEAVETENAALKKQVEELQTKNAELQAAIAKFDPDGDGKPGGSKAKA